MRTSILYAALVLLMPSTVFAGRDLGLKEAINLALENNNLIKAADFEQIAARHETAASRSRYLPRIFFDETASVSNAPTRVFMMKLDEGRFSQNDFAIGNLNHPSGQSDFRTSVTLDMPLFDAAVYHGVQIAATEEKSRNWAFARRREDVAFMVFSAYLEVQRSRGLLKAADQAVTSAREHLRLASVRNEAGVGLKSDELRARAFLAEMEQQNISAGNNLSLAKLRLAQAAGGKPGEAFDIREELGPLPLKTGNEDLLMLALENRTDLKELASGVEKAAITVKLARSAYLPTLYGTAAYQMNNRDIPFGSDNDSWMAGVSLRWELFDGMRRSHEKGKAEALRSSAAESLENYRKEVAVQVEESKLRCEEAGKRREVALNAVQYAEEAVRLISRRFENSLERYVDLLDAQTALNRARAQFISNESDYALATARLFSTTGTFLKEVLQ
jgi:outer membrane protein